MDIGRSSNAKHLNKKLTGMKPNLITLIDVIEHVENPITLLQSIAKSMSKNTVFVLSTPDRKTLEAAEQKGPPTNFRHVREWSHQEMCSLLECVGLSIIETKHVLPRSYRFTVREILRILVRIILFRRIPDRKSSMIFVCEVRLIPD